MTVGELKARLDQASPSAEVIGTDIDGEEFLLAGVRVEDEAVYLSLDEMVTPDEE